MPGTTFNTATTALAVKCITWGENEVNKYLSRRYDLSSNYFQVAGSVPPLVTTWTELLAEGYLHQKLSRGGPESMDRGQKIIDGVLKNLERIADYEGHLVDSSGDVIADMSNSAYRVLSNTDGYAQTFDEDDPLNWAVDSNKLSDIESGRI